MYYLTPHGLNRLVYPDWKENTFTVGKQVSTIFNIKDRWWFEDHRAKDQTMFISCIESYYKKFTTWGFNYFKKSKEANMNFAQDFRHLNIDLYYSKKHYLES
jgi:hypothetical protein